MGILGPLDFSFLVTIVAAVTAPKTLLAVKEVRIGRGPGERKSCGGKIPNHYMATPLSSHLLPPPSSFSSNSQSPSISNPFLFPSSISFPALRSIYSSNPRTRKFPKTPLLAFSSNNSEASPFHDAFGSNPSPSKVSFSNSVLILETYFFLVKFRLELLILVNYFCFFSSFLKKNKKLYQYWWTCLDWKLGYLNCSWVEKVLCLDMIELF